MNYFTDALQTYIILTLGIVGLAPDHHSKVNIAINRVSQFLGFPNVYKSYVYTIVLPVKYAVGLCPKKYTENT